MALCMVKSKAKEALEAGAVSAQKLNEAINDIRKGRTADSRVGGRRAMTRSRNTRAI